MAPPRTRSRTFRGLAAVPSILALVMLAVAPAAGFEPAAAGASAAGTAPISDPASLVDPFMGTGTAPTAPGDVDEFPGADAPFGMLQWSPDTTPDRFDGSGYSWADSRTTGFSLTHLSGPGCSIFGDVPILPTVGPVRRPATASDTFSHHSESASPGRYGVTLGPAPIATRLAVTTRTGIGSFSYPSSQSANLLFKASGSANGVVDAGARTDGDEEVSGWAESGQFCGTPGTYTLYFVARFDRPFAASGTWRSATVDPGSQRCQGEHCGLYVSFDTTSDRQVLVKVGISFVSLADARLNLAAEDPGWSVAAVAAQAHNRWNALLGRVAIGGGTGTEQQEFYTALYHSLLHPNVFSDVNGDYVGFDHQVHRNPGHVQYADMSDWDIYRSEVPLLALAAPSQTSQMMESLVLDAQQGGWLPKWPLADDYTQEGDGDSSDAVIADAYAFGARNFDSAGALEAMVKGATDTDPATHGQGWYTERQDLAQYVADGYVDTDARDITSFDYTVGGSETLEYALDDFSIARLALALGDRPVYTEMMARAQNWENLFNPATGYLQSRQSDGSFPPGPAFQPAHRAGVGQEGFEEGNAVQYTWTVTQNLQALVGLMGGGPVATAKLDSFFTHLNAGRYVPYDWSGNEPDLAAPWLYDFTGAPWRTQAVVRRIVATQYHDGPAAEPGNDDLGALSSWLVWADIGLYPVTPGTANLVMASPLFPLVSIHLADGRQLDLSASGASATTPYVKAMTVDGRRWTHPWLPASVLRTGAGVDFTLSAVPDVTWGSTAAAAPPSYGTGEDPAVGFTLPSGEVTLRPRSTATVSTAAGEIRLGIQTLATDEHVAWTATAPAGVTVTPGSGVLVGPSRAQGGRAAETLHLSSNGPRISRIVFTLTAPGSTIPPVVMVVKTK